MKRYIAVSVIMLQVLFCQAGEKITIVEFVHPPFAYLDTQTNEAKGAEIAFISDILKDLGYQPNFTFVPFARMVPTMEAGDADIGPLLAKTPEREKFMNFSSTSVLTMIPVIVVLNESPLKTLKAPSDLKDMKIGFAVNQTTPSFFDNSGLPPFELVTGDNLTEQNFKKLIGQRINACIELNPINVRIVAKSMGITDKIRTVNIPGNGTVFYLTISKKTKLSTAIVNNINAKLNSKKFIFDKYLQDELK
jgi:polar amino acid transport system substrate-binding protein